jgi:hypothetical protein
MAPSKRRGVPFSKIFRRSGRVKGKDSNGENERGKGALSQKVVHYIARNPKSHAFPRETGSGGLWWSCAKLLGFREFIEVTGDEGFPSRSFMVQGAGF